QVRPLYRWDHGSAQPVRRGVRYRTFQGFSGETRRKPGTRALRRSGKTCNGMVREQRQRTARRPEADRGGLQHRLKESTMNRTAQRAVPVEAPQNRFTSGPAIVLYVVAAKLLLHLLTVARYGIFRDEM